MNWDQIEGNWKQLKGSAKQQWGKLTDDQLDVIAGKRDRLAGKIQETYGITKEATEKQLSDWQVRMEKVGAESKDKTQGSFSSATGKSSSPTGKPYEKSDRL